MGSRVCALWVSEAFVLVLPDHPSHSYAFRSVCAYLPVHRLLFYAIAWRRPAGVCRRDTRVSSRELAPGTPSRLTFAHAYKTPNANKPIAISACGGPKRWRGGRQRSLLETRVELPIIRRGKCMFHVWIRARFDMQACARERIVFSWPKIQRGKNIIILYQQTSNKQNNDLKWITWYVQFFSEALLHVHDFTLAEYRDYTRRCHRKRSGMKRTRHRDNYYTQQP